MCGCRGRAEGWLLGKPWCSYPSRKERPTSRPSPVAYRAPLRQALIDDNAGHVNVVVCETDYRALKRGIEHLPPPMQ